MAKREIDDLNNQIKELEKELTGDLFKDLDVQDKIHNLKMTRDGIKPVDTFIDCVGCGS